MFLLGVICITKIWLLQSAYIFVLLKKNKVMASKILEKNCNCVHCKQKLEQINRSKDYWNRVITKNFDNI